MATTLQEVSENWDDDFEFQVERRKMSASAASVKKSEAATENWDDDFEDSRQSPKKMKIQRHREESWDEEEEEEEEESGEFGLFAEEDRTVTAKSRRVALARLSSPPLPPGYPPHAFPPRSPTSSVFSVPTTIHTYSSTTHLRPTSAFASIPPSPPIHKERERRRLRKKSRPKPQGVFELADLLPPSQERKSFSDVEVDLPRPVSELGIRRMEMSSRSDLSSVDERPPLVVAADTSSGPVATPTKGAALLSRIGSVKKWGVRRKSTAPAEVMAIDNESKWDPKRTKRGDSTTPLEASRDTQSQAQSTSYLPTPGRNRRRGGSTTPADVISSDRRSEFDPRLAPRASSSLSSYQRQHQHQHYPVPPPPPVPPPVPPPLPVLPHAELAPQLRPQQRTASSSSNWFFRSSSKSSNNTNTPVTTTTAINTNTSNELGSTFSSPSNAAVQSKRSRSRSRSGVRSGRDGDGDGITNPVGNRNPNGITHGTGTGNPPNGIPNSNFYSTRTSNASRTDLSEREESSLGRKISGSGSWKRRQDTGTGTTGNPKLPTLTPMTTPTKLVKRKSFGFVHLGRGFSGHGSGENELVSQGREVVGYENEEEIDEDGEGEERKEERVGRAQNQLKDVMQERYAGLGLGRAGAGAVGGGGDDEYEGSETSKRNRRRSLSRLLMDRDSKDKDKDELREKEKEKENEQHQHHHPKEKEKEGTRSFMGGVRRISLVTAGVVGRHKRTKSGGAGLGVGGVPPVPSSLPPVLTSASQVSLRIPSATMTNTGSSQRYAPSNNISNVNLQRSTSLSSPPTGGGSGDPASSSATSSATATPIRSHSRPPSISSASSRRRRRLSKSKPKPRESQEPRDRASLDLQECKPSEGNIIIPKTPTPSTTAAPAIASSAIASSSSSSSSEQPLPAAVAATPLLPPIELQPPSPPRTTTTMKRHIQRRSRAYTTNEFIEGLELESLVAVPSSTSSSAVFYTPTTSISRNNVGAGTGGILPLPTTLSSPNNKLSPGKSSQSQQSVSLGRSTAVNVTAGGGSGGGDENAGLSLASGSGGGGGGAGGGLLRRNSLGDLKIPARISQAQVGLRRDLGMVREFANNVERLKELQMTYNTLVGQVQALLDTHIQRVQLPQPPPLPAAIIKTASPNFFTQLKARPKIRTRSNTNPTIGSPTIPTPDVDSSSSQAVYKSLVEGFWSINSKYRISWECAELLIELGGGSGGGDVSGTGGGGGEVMSAPPTTSASAPVVQQQQHLIGAGGEEKMASLRGRERAITLVGDESKQLPSTPPPLPLPTPNDVQSQPSSPVVSITGSSNLPSGMQPANATCLPLASPPSISWRASTGRHDLSQRQLVLLREMLNNNNNITTSSIPVVAEDENPESRLAASALSPYYPSSSHSQFVNRDWRWGDVRNSTITLSEEQEVGFEEGGSRRKDRKMEKEKKRRSGRLGMSGIRDMLRSLKKSHVEEPNSGMGEVQSGQQQQRYLHHHHHGYLVPMMHSTTSLSTESSIGSKSVHYQAQAQAQQQQQQQNRLPIPRIPSQIRRRGRSSTGPESMRSNKVPSPTLFSPSSFTAPKPSPRRPSLASIFRIGSGNNNTKTRPVSSVDASVGVEDLTVSSGASEHDLSAAQCSSGTGGEDSNSTGEGEEDWDRMDSASDLDGAAAKALGIVDGASAYDISATVRGRKTRTTKADEKKVGVSPYLRHQSSYESDHQHHQHHAPPPVPLLPASSSTTGLGGFLARHSIIPKRSFSASQSSIWGSGVDGQQHSPTVPSRLSRHSNFEEQQPMNVEPASLRISSSQSAPTTTTAAQTKLPNVASVSLIANSTPGASSRPSSSRSTTFPNAKTGSVRSMPPHLVTSSSLLPSGFQGQQPSSDPKLAMIMTPENIKPLLENTKEVHMKLHECIAEIRALIEDGGVAAAAIGT